MGKSGATWAWRTRAKLTPALTLFEETLTVGIFHDATRQAIREMIEEFGETSRFGHILNEQDLEAAAARIASFFEMTLELRAGLAGGAPPKEKKRMGPGRGPLGPGFLEPEDVHSPRGPAFARTRAAAEVAAEENWSRQAGATLRSDDTPRLPVDQDFRLPRKRVGATDVERDTFAQKGLRRER
jgi:hypothetical protein